MLSPEARLLAGGRSIPRARTFSSVTAGSAFWYENSNGLAEIAVNMGVPTRRSASPSAARLRLWGERSTQRVAESGERSAPSGP
jgi:hypothetical protein